MPKPVTYTVKVPPALNEKLNILVAESGKDTVEKYLVGNIRQAWKDRANEVADDE